MGLETGIYINDLVVTNPPGTDGKNQGDDHIRLEKSTVKNSFAGFLGAVLVTGVDGGVADVYTLTPATALPSYTSKTLIEFTPVANNLTSTPTLNISGLGAKTIKSVSGATLLPNELVAGTPVLASYDGTSMLLIGPTKKYIDQSIVNGIIPAQSLGFYRSNGVVSDYTQTHTGYAQNEVKGADIASASTINLTTATGNLVHVTGTTTITAITIPVGAERTVIFDGALTLTHGAGLLLPGAVNITTAANDRADIRGDTAGAIVTNFTRASGKSIASPFTSLLVFTTTQTWTAPAGVSLVELTLTDGGAAGNNAAPSNGANGAITGVTLVSVTPGVVYTLTVGAAGVVPVGVGGASSMAGSGLTTVTTTNSTLRISGDVGGLLVGANDGLGGSSFLGNYGAGGNGNANGQTGVAVIRF